MAQPRSTFTSRAKASLSQLRQNFAETEDAAARRGDTAGQARMAARRERVERALDKVYARGERRKKRRRAGGGRSSGS